MHRFVRTCLATALVGTALGATAAPASADRWWGRDRAGDVEQVTLSPEPPPCGTYALTRAPQDRSTDIVGLSVVHGRDDIVLRAHYRDLSGWAGRSVTFALATDRRDYEVQVWGRRPIEVEVWSAPSKPEPTGQCDTYITSQIGGACDALLRVAPDRAVIEITVPRTCVGDPHWVRAGVRNDRMIGGRYRSDVWGRSDIGSILDDAPLSPRVRHGS